MKEIAYETKKVNIPNLLRDKKITTGFIGNGFKSHLFSPLIYIGHGIFMDIEKISCRNSRGQLKKK